MLPPERSAVAYTAVGLEQDVPSVLDDAVPARFYDAPVMAGSPRSPATRPCHLTRDSVLPSCLPGLRIEVPSGSAARLTPRGRRMFSAASPIATGRTHGSLSARRA